MAASIESALRHRSRGRATIGWSELLPRYLLVEDALSKKRVLEIGTIDLRSLLRIHDAKATRVVGTAPDISRLDSALVRGRRIELSPMEPGRVDFDDQSFDAILVVDLGLELAANARFLDELKRVLSPDGFCAIAYQAGRSFLELVEDGGSLVAIDPSRLEAAVREAMPEARFYLQSPFIGVSI
jgi:SAM-dependent methyltransferase